MSAPAIDWASTGEEVTDLLRDLLRLDTTNPPGNEIIAAEHIAGVLGRAGLEPVVLESQPKRGSVVARLRGTGEAGPLLLMSHLDVVPTEPAEWSHTPFGGDVADGYVWGRGALDMKNTVATHLMVMLMLARQGTPLKRDVIFMSSADEETDGTLGAGFLVEKHPDLIRAEYALNEGGGQSFPVGGIMFYTVQTAEKGLARFRLRAHGRPGHGSVPRADNAVARLGEAVWRLGSRRLPLHRTRTMDAMLDGFARALPNFASQAPALLDDTTHERALASFPASEAQRLTLSAMLHNTATPTVLEAGTKVNVIPSTAEALVDGRTLPGYEDSFWDEVRAVVGDGLDIEPLGDRPALEAPMESPLYRTIVDRMSTHLPGARPVPTMLTGATDAKHIVRLGTRVYGFTPHRYEPSVADLPLVHGHDERISVDNLLFGLQVIYDVVTAFAGR